VTHNIIRRHQHGFLSKKSTFTQLFECNLDWSIALNGRRPVDIVFLDYAKAFDSVVHKKLIYILSCYGVCEMVLTWIENFLSERVQSVKIGDCFSPYRSVTSGVPQGSVLGPVLFVLFVNDIIYCADSSVTIKMFADDTKLYTVIVDDSSVANLQSSLDRIHRWSNHRQLKLSPTKCTVMPLCKPSDNSLVDVNYSLCSSILPTVSSVTDLGVSYDSHLSFRPHINKIVSKASQRAKLILKCFVA